MKTEIKLGEALSQLKREKSRLARLILLRKENVFVEVGKSSAFDPKELTKEIDAKIEEIRNLKIKIQETNLKTLINDESMTLAEAIIKIGDLRSQIAHLSTLFEKKRDSWFSRDKDEKDTRSQLSELKIEEEIEKLEREKVRLDNKLQIINWTTIVVD